MKQNNVVKEGYTVPEVRVVLKEGMTKYSDHSIVGTSDAADIVSQILGDTDREVLIVLNLDTSMKPISYNIVSIGSLNLTVAFIGNIFKSAILSNASGIILAHSHPSGVPTPSEEDLDTTIKSAAAGFMLGIPLLDHIIVGSGTRMTYSFASDHPKLFSVEYWQKKFQEERNA